MIKLLVLFFVWFVFLYFVEFFYPSSFTKFKSYGFSYDNLIKRRRVHLSFVMFLPNLIVFPFVLYFVSFFFTFFLFFCFFFFLKTIYEFYSIKNNKSYWLLYDSSFDMPVINTFISLIKYSFISQSFYCGRSLGYHLLKRMYGESSNFSWFILIRDRFGITIIGFSYFILSFSKEFTLCLVESFYDEELNRKKNKIKIFFRLVLLRLVFLQTFIFNVNKNCVKNYKIYFGDKIIFNPPKLNSFHKVSRSLERGFGSNKSHLKIDHLAVLDNSSNSQTHLIMTTRPLEGQIGFISHGNKKNSTFVYNNIVSEELYDNTLNHHLMKIAEDSGVTDPYMLENIKNTAHILRLCTDKTTHQFKPGKHNIIQDRKSFFKSALDLNNDGKLKLSPETVEEYKMLDEFTEKSNKNLLSDLEKNIINENIFRDNTVFVGITNNDRFNLNKFLLNNESSEQITNSVKPSEFSNINDIKHIMNKNYAVTKKKEFGYLSPILKKDNKNIKNSLLTQYIKEDYTTNSPDNPFKD